MSATRKGGFAMTDFHLMTSPCGRDCFNCPLYHAGKNPKLAGMLAARFGIPAEELPCEGCRPSEGKCRLLKSLGLSFPCSVYLCSVEKKVEFCSACADFPCERLHPLADRADLLPHNLKVFNLCMIRKMGLESWAECQAKSSFDMYFKGKLGF
jgi:hypothetical protein